MLMKASAALKMDGLETWEPLMLLIGELDWSPLYISLKTGIVATILCFFLGIFAACSVMRLSGRLRAAVDGILTLPMVLPPTVAGFFCCFYSAEGGRLACFCTTISTSGGCSRGSDVCSPRR